MKIKPDWTTDLHLLRKREIDLIFRDCHYKQFGTGLELGAGDGYQSELLSQHIQKLICTEVNQNRLKNKTNTDSIMYFVCDADNLDHICLPNTIDIIFTSNLLEHLGNREDILRNISGFLKKDGIAIHVVPGQLMKLSWMLGFHFNLFIELLEVVFSRGGLKRFVARLPREVKAESIPQTNENNLAQSGRTFWQKYIFPTPHGEYASHGQEFFAYCRSQWIKLFQSANYEIIATLKMPVVSGYGFGLKTVGRIMELLGFNSSWAFILKQKGQRSPYEKIWSGRHD